MDRALSASPLLPVPSLHTVANTDQARGGDGAAAVTGERLRIDYEQMVPLQGGMRHLQSTLSTFCIVHVALPVIHELSCFLRLNLLY